VGEGGQQHATVALSLGNETLPIVQKAGCASGPFLTVAENLGPTDIRSPYRPVPNKSLYRLRYPRPCCTALVVVVVVEVVVVFVVVVP
jgi:hypothetical protein